MNIQAYTKAFHFALDAHNGQTRKNGTTPYIVHPPGVAIILARYGGTDDQIVAAILHDTVEDTGATHDDIREHFGEYVAELVAGLTNTSKQDAPHLNRKARKALDCERLRQTPVDIKLPKLADILYNVNDLDGLERGFAIKFLKEKLEQAEAVCEGSEELYLEVVTTIERQLIRMENM